MPDPLNRVNCRLPERAVDDLAELSLARPSLSLPESAVDHQNVLHFGDELLFCTVVYRQNAPSLAKLGDVML